MKRIHRRLNPQTRNASLAPFFSATILVTTAALALAAWQLDPPQPGGQQTSQEASPYLRWLNEDVAYIINAEERAAFNRLATDEERKKFIEQFWLRRDPTPGTVENEVKDEHYRRIVYANAHFVTQSGKVGWRTDRGYVYIKHGAPDRIRSYRAGGPGQYPSEVWMYRHLEGIGDQIEVKFADRKGDGDYGFTVDPPSDVTIWQGRP